MVASFIDFVILDPNPMKLTDAQTYSSVPSYNIFLIQSCFNLNCLSYIFKINEHLVKKDKWTTKVS
jgi:hypothetical protein